MTIQFYPDELNYVNAMLHPLAHRDPDSFLGAFFAACRRADPENYELLRPIVHKFMEKYPASPKILEIEKRDSGRA